jgi:hypothetical protein
VLISSRYSKVWHASSAIAESEVAELAPVRAECIDDGEQAEGRDYPS